jgi:hypothetical protein
LRRREGENPVGRGSRESGELHGAIEY